ncbi:MAG: glycosyltransferase family 2 protein [Terriglobia bacterium]
MVRWRHTVSGELHQVLERGERETVMAGSPTIAVVIPAYNCAAYIEEALDSIAAQTRAPDRVVVVDDGSTDGSAEIVARFMQRSSMPVQLLRQPNAGIAAARNAGVAQCQEDLLAFLDADDTFYPTFLERAGAVLARHAELVLCFLDRDVVDARGKFLRRDLDHPAFRAIPAVRLSDGTSVLAKSPFATLASGNVIPIGLMVRRSAFHQVGGFDVEQRAVEDLPFLMRLTKVGKFGFIDEPLGIWRRHGANTSGRNNSFGMAMYNDMALAKLEREAPRWSFSAEELAAIRRERNRIAGSLLYTASDEARIAFFTVAARLLWERRVRWLPVLRGCLRYARRWVSRRSGE